MKRTLFGPGWLHNVWNGDADGKSKQQYRDEERWGMEKRAAPEDH